MGASLVAFARTTDAATALFVAPRFTAPLMNQQHPLPIGGERWKTSRVLLPPPLATRVFRHELTGAEITPMVTDSQAWIFAGQLFDVVPVAILTAE